MSAYNATCFASRQTIVEGEPCLIFPITQQATYNPVSVVQGDVKTEMFGIAHEVVGPDSFWRFKSAVVTGKAVEAALIELDDTEANRRAVLLNVADLVKSAAATQQGENQSHDVPFDLPAFMTSEAPSLSGLLTDQWYARPSVDHTKEQVWTALKKVWRYVELAARQHRIFARVGGRLRPFELASMHKTAFDELVKSVAVLKNWEGNSLAPRDFFDSAVAAATASTAEYRTFLETSKSEYTDRDLEFHFSYTAFPSEFKRMGFGQCETLAIEGRALPRAATLFWRQQISQDQFCELLMPILEQRYAMRGMANMNIKFTPMEYAGDESNYLGKGYRAFVAAAGAAIDETIARKHRELMGEDDVEGEDAPAAHASPPSS